LQKDYSGGINRRSGRTFLENKIVEKNSMDNHTLLAAVLRGLARTRTSPRKTQQWRAIGEELGIPFNTIYQIGTGMTANPGVRTVQLIYDYFSREMPWVMDLPPTARERHKETGKPHSCACHD
jgi:hypothetical protein